MGWQRTLNVEVMDASPRSFLLPSSTSYHFLARPTPWWFLGWTLVFQGNLAPRSPQTEYSLRSLAFGYRLDWAQSNEQWVLTVSLGCFHMMSLYFSSSSLPQYIYIYIYSQKKKKRKKTFTIETFFSEKIMY